MSNPIIYPIHVAHGGERLYVHPIAVNPDYRENKVHFFHPMEFAPYANDHILTRTSMYYQMFSITRLIMIALRRTLVVLYRCRSWSTRWIKWLWTTTVPVIAIEMYDWCFSVQGQLSVLDEEGLSDTCYLNPSQKWLTGRVEEWIAASLPMYATDTDDVEWHMRERNRFVAWRERMIEQGLDIVYLCSVDT